MLKKGNLTGINFFFALCICTVASSSQALSLQEAWKQIKTNHPRIASSQASIGAAQGQLLQAGLLPNPVFNTVQGNIPGFGKYSDNPNAQTTYMVSQLIETGGKRCAREEIASAQVQESHAAYQANSAELFAQTVQAYLSVAEEQLKLNLSKQGIVLNQKTIHTIGQRIKAGRGSSLDLQTSHMALSNQKLQATTIESELMSSQYALARLWNGSSSQVSHMTVPSVKNMPLYSLSYYLDRIKNNRELETLYQSLNIAKAEVKLAGAKQFPDVTVGVGVEHFYQSSSPKSQNAVIAEFGVPIPLFDRNQGNYASSTANHRKALEEVRDKELMLQSNIVKAYQIAYQTKMQMNILHTSLLPQSQQTLKLAQRGYSQGRYSYLDLLNAQQKLIDSKAQEVSARFLYYRAWYALQILIGNLPQKEDA